jgi:SAM-dependent methyltransferase
MSRIYTTPEVLSVYQDHPLSCHAILQRINRHRPVEFPIGELELAVDGAEHLTDQNHIGGALSTLRLGAKVQLTSQDRVLDLGCGIGGPARVVADVFGCSVRGVDANAARIEEAIQLTELVGLHERVTYQCLDFLEQRIERIYTVVWAQNSWIHIDEPDQLASIAASCLVPNGRLAFEDVYLGRDPADAIQAGLMSQLCDSWRSSFSSLNTWYRAFERSGFRIATCEDQTDTMIRHYECITALAARTPNKYPAHEILGWDAALALVRSGVLGYARIVGQLVS